MPEAGIVAGAHAPKGEDLVQAGTQSSFLDSFDDVWLTPIIDWANRISTLDADVALVMARKPACLLDAMIEFGLARPSCPITTNRVLDMDTEWLRGKKVALVDDLLISGSTLYKASRAVTDAGATISGTHVICVDRDWWNPDLVRPQQPYVSANSQSALELSNQIVEALSLVPRPYNIDWPIYKGISLAANEASVLGSFARWWPSYTTSPSQQSAGIVTVTHDADRSVREKLEATLGCTLGTGSLVKVKIYWSISSGAWRTLGSPCSADCRPRPRQSLRSRSPFPSHRPRHSVG